MTSPPPRWRGTVPPIPASRLAPVAQDDAILLHVHHGVATVDLDGHATLEAAAGQAVWLPPGQRHSALLEAGSVALPVIVPVDALPEALSRARVVVVPPTWTDWLVFRVARWFGFTAGARPDRSRLLDLLAGIVPADAGTDASRRPRLPPLPRSPAPRSVIERLLRDPACPATLAELAAEAMISPRTLQRQLDEQTGHGLAQWRTAIRIDAAADHLSRGRDLGWTAHHVGYASLSGFAHAFAARVGVSPGRFAADRGLEGGTERRDRPLVDDVATLVAPAGPSSPPVVPGVPPAAWITPFDSVLWVYRGTARVQAAGRRTDLREGDVIWLGRGVSHLLEVTEGSIVLPLGWKPGGRPVRADSLHVLRMPRDEQMERFLLHTVVANHFLLRPPDHDDQAFLEVLHPSSPRPAALPPHLEVIVSTLIDDPSDPRSLADWADDLDMDPARLRRAFRADVGESFPRWRATVRMTQARALMADGRPPSVVARRLGYARQCAFSKAFSAAHGMPPREWIRREAG